MIWSRFCIALVSIAGVVGNVNAAVIIGDIAGTTRTSGYLVGSGAGRNNAIAEGFTMGSQSYNLTSVDLYLLNFTAGSPGVLQLSIYSDVAGKPGVNLYDLSTNVIGTTSGTATLATFTGSGSFILNANTKYWLDFYANPSTGTGNNVFWSGVTPSTFSGVGATDVGQLRSVGGGNTFSGSPSTTELRTAYQLNGDLVTAAVPEPASMAIWGIGALGCAIAGYRRRKAA